MVVRTAKGKWSIMLLAPLELRVGKDHGETDHTHAGRRASRYPYTLVALENLGSIS